MGQALWTASEAAAAAGGVTSGDWRAAGVSIDSRTLAAGDLFVALEGPNFDGHGFLEAAFEAGAAAAMVHKKDLPENLRGPLLRVDDTLRGLTDLGAAARLRSQASFIGVTGSVGKTGTKEALRACLSAQAPTAANIGSLNNHWGVPLSLARMDPAAVYGVFEMGMNHPGEIRRLSNLVRPRVAIITNVEPAHIEFFNSVAEIAEAKAEIFEGVAQDGVAVLNRDHALFHLLRERALGAGLERIVGFGRHPEAEARALDYELDEAGSQVRARILGQEVAYRIALPGAHWVANSLAVLAAAVAAGAELEPAAAALAALSPLKGRGERHEVTLAEGPVTLIDDSYNANPASMRAAFQVLAQTRVPRGGRRLAVLGDMLELGDGAATLHARLAEPLVAAGIDRVFTCGAAMASLNAALPKEMRGGHAADSEALAPLLLDDLATGDAVLVKGSLGSRMAHIVKVLQDLGSPPPRAANGE